MTEAEMEQLARQLERKYGRAWAEMVEHLRATNKLGDIEAAIARRDPQAVLANIEEAARAFASDVNSGFTLAQQRAATWLNDQVPGKLIRFDVQNERSVGWMRRNSLSLVRGVTEEQRNVIREAMTSGLERGENPKVIARRIRDSIGLTPHQARWVDNYRRSLETGDFADALGRELSDGRYDRGILSAQRNGRTLSRAEIDRAVDKYRANAITMRAETIARTEAIRSAAQGSHELVRTAVERGDVQERQLVRRWLHRNRGKHNRDFHHVMNGQERGLNEPFRSGLGNELMFPCDPAAPAEETINCRCAVTTRYIRAARVAPPPEPPPQAPPVVEAPKPPVVAAPPVAPKPPKEKKPKPSARRSEVHRRMTEARVETLQPVGEQGTNASYWVTLENGQRAIFKPRSGEATEVRDNIPSFTGYRREAAASDVASIMGVDDLVPATVVREFETRRFERVPLTAEEIAALPPADDGWGDLATIAPRDKAVPLPVNANTLPSWADGSLAGPGSLQEIAEDARGIEFAREIDRDAAERTLVFDFVTGNSDRHARNILVRHDGNKSFPVLIDNGLTFPEGHPVRFIQPRKLMEQVSGQLLPTTFAQIKSINASALAAGLHARGISASAIESTLERLFALRNDSRLLVRQDTKPSDDTHWRGRVDPTEIDNALKPSDRKRIASIMEGLK
jgi:hypothetical protein